TWVKRRAVKVILAYKAESQFVANCFADAAGTGAEKLLHAYSMRDGRRMRIAPGRITATGFAACHIDYILNSEAQSIQRTTSGRGQIKCRHESIAFIDSNRGRLHSG